MKVIVRKVFYCEHCARHRMRASSIEKHEPRCIYNPDRSRCGWHESAPEKPADLMERFLQALDIDWLRGEVDGCPACMLAVVVQAVKGGVPRDHIEFEYRDEVDRFRKMERRHSW